MPISSGFSQELNPNYYVRKPLKREVLDETIYYKHDEPYQRPVEIVNRPIIKETVFLPDRREPQLMPTRDYYTVAPEPVPMQYPTTTTSSYPITRGSFDLVQALGLNADCPCWVWLCIIFGFIILLALAGMCLYFLIERDGHV